MSTYLELCEDFREQIGVSGTISSVIGQIGLLEKLVNWVAQADVKVQSLWANWDFLWATWDLTLVATIDEYSPPSLLGRFDIEDFWIDSGTDDAAKIAYKEYREYKRSYKHLSVDDGYPDLITITPAKKVRVWPAPSSAEAGKIISVDYWKKPVTMSDNTEISLIPEQFHQIILERAKMFHAVYVHSDGKYSAAMAEYARLLKELEAHSLPGQQEDRTSTAAIPHVIEAY